MAITPPTTPPADGPAMPEAPSTSDVANFDAEGDAFLAAMGPLQTEIQLAKANVYTNTQAAYTNASEAQASAVAAAGSATSAASSANTVPWVSGTNYAQDTCVSSPINSITYRRTANSPGSSTTDPSADSVRWKSLFLNTAWIRKTTTYTAVSGDHIKASTTGGAWSLTFPSAPSDGDEIEVQDVDGTFHTNNLTVLANGKKIMGFTTSWVLNSRYFRQKFVYDATNGDWRV